MEKVALPSEFPRWTRNKHYSARTEFCRSAMAAGWVPLSKRQQAPARAASGQHALPLGAQQTAIPNGRDHHIRDTNKYWLERGKAYISEQRLYTETYKEQERFIIESIVDACVPMQNVLEIGCGYGRLTRRIAEQFPTARITALDLSPDQIRNALEYCKAHLNRISFQQFDVLSEDPLPANRYDAIVAFETYLHFPPHLIHKLLQRLAYRSDFLLNYDWSEPEITNTAPHVWVHDFGKIYEELGLQWREYVEPQLITGQQQKLFVATSRETGFYDSHFTPPGSNAVLENLITPA